MEGVLKQLWVGSSVILRLSDISFVLENDKLSRRSCLNTSFNICQSPTTDIIEGQTQSLFVLNPFVLKV